MPECFNPRLCQLVKPIKSTGEIISHVNVPCGKCSNCIKRRRMEWCFRMEEEMKVSKCAYFVTFTYSPENVPYDKWGNMVLVATRLDSKRNFLKANGRKDIKDKYLSKMKLKGWKDDSIQGFFKRLRVRHERSKEITREMFYNGLDKRDKVKYYVCGEYGDSIKHTGRPHYHAIIFNCAERHIVEEWGLGDIQVVKATPETIAYCTKYMDKWKDKKQDWKRPIEFNNASEGIGKSFCDRMQGWYKSNLDINFVVNDCGVRIPMPRYFRNRMFTEDERSYQTGLIFNAMKQEKEEQIRNVGENEFYRRKKSAQKYKEMIFKKNTKKRGNE